MTHKSFANGYKIRPLMIKFSLLKSKNSLKILWNLIFIFNSTVYWDGCKVVFNAEVCQISLILIKFKVGCQLNGKWSKKNKVSNA